MEEKHDNETAGFMMADPSDKNATKKSQEAKADRQESGCVMIYGVDERPSWTTIALMGLQHFSISFSGVLSMPLLLVGPMCFDRDRQAMNQMLATTFFMCGITTFLQTGLGSRLPIVQGASLTFIFPAIVMMSTKGPCPPHLTANSTIEETKMVRDEAYGRMLEVQGCLAMASLMQIFLGFSGLTGVLLRFVGPITIATTLILIGLPLLPIASDACGTHWGIACLCIFLITLFSQVLDRFDIPCPRGNKFSLFTFFPILLAVAITWILCLILTASGAFPDDPSVNGYLARTDVFNEGIKNSPWFHIPYPGQWGTPRLTWAGFIGMCAGAIGGIVESVGDYHACAMICNIPPPPHHSINRGVGCEGIGCLVAGIIGSGVGSTSYSNNIATMGITKVCSRAVIYFTSFLFILGGIFSKFSAFCTALPAPIIGAMMATTLGMVASIGFANLSFVKVNTSRNLFILGLALFVGLGVPDYVAKNPESLNTASPLLTQILNAILRSNMLIGGVTACLCDNLIRGTAEEKGTHWREVGVTATGVTVSSETDEEIQQTGPDLSVYDLPFGMSWIRKTPWTRYLPFSPTFTGFKKPKFLIRSHSRL